MNKNPIHMTDAEKSLQTSQSTVSAIQENTAKVDEVVHAIGELHNTSKDKSVSAIGFTGMIQSQQETNKKLDDLKDYIDHPEIVVKKLEEVKSASLITNKLLKELTKKEYPKPEKFPEFPTIPPFPEIPKVDLSETNVLLKQVISFQEKMITKTDTPIDVSITLKIS